MERIKGTEDVRGSEAEQAVVEIPCRDRRSFTSCCKERAAMGSIHLEQEML